VANPPLAANRNRQLKLKGIQIMKERNLTFLSSGSAYHPARRQEALTASRTRQGHASRSNEGDKQRQSTT